MRPSAASLVVVAALLAAPGAAAAVTPLVSVAVLATEVDESSGAGADKGIAKQVTARIAEVLQRRPGTTVMSADDISAVLQHEADKQLLGCNEDGCLAELAAALGADVVVASKVAKIEDGWAISLTAIDTKRATVKARVQETWQGESILLLSLVAPAVDKLMATDPNSLVGTLDVVGAVDGTKILVDDQVRGTAPAGQMAGIPIGSRRVKLVADGYEPVEAYLIVQNGEVASFPAQQRAIEPFYATWWFWTAAGAGTVVAAAAATTVGVVAAMQLGAGGGPPGKSGVTISVNADDALAGAR